MKFIASILCFIKEIYQNLFQKGIKWANYFTPCDPLYPILPYDGSLNNGARLFHN